MSEGLPPARGPVNSPGNEPPQGLPQAKPPQPAQPAAQAPAPAPRPQPASAAPPGPAAAPPGEDAAARFRKPGQQPAAAPAPQQPALPAPGLGELFERSLTGLVVGRSAYEPLASRPAPGYGAMTALALAYTVIGLGLNVALTAVASPTQLGAYPTWFYAAVTGGALGFSLAWLLLFAAILFGLSKALGGQGGFERGYLAAAMLFALAPVHSLSGLFPYAWLLPCVLLAWAGAGALSGLSGASFSGALMAFTVLSSLLIAGQGVARAAYAKSQEVLAQNKLLLDAGANAQNAAALIGTLQQMQQAQGGQPLSGGAPPPVVPELPDGAPAGEQAAQTHASGLDLIGGGEAAQDQRVPSPEEQKRMLQQGDMLRTQVVAMLESITPMMDNPAITKNLDAQGKADVQELRKELAKLKDTTARNVKLSDEEFNATMQKIQKMTMRLMMSGAGMAQPAAPQAKPGAKK